MRPHTPDLICFSHLRWNFVFQRPQHLMVRFAARSRVFFIEEPIWGAETPSLSVQVADGVHVVVPHLPHGLAGFDTVVRRMLRELLYSERVEKPVLWFYTPLALPLADGIIPSAVIYDCMDELSGFAGASPELQRYERELFELADVVFTGGVALYEAKRLLHTSVHAFPSSVDVAHFARARSAREAEDQSRLPRPRIGFCGVIDERMDIELLDRVSLAKPDWQFVMIGPVVKIDSSHLPARPNIHYLGMRKYDELPGYMCGWDVAMLPFARNAATRYISPTKTPEYLAAGLPVVSTSIRDVVRPYGDRGLVAIADAPDDFIAAVTRLMTPEGRPSPVEVEAWLSGLSWDRTWAGMNALTMAAASRRAAPARVKDYLAIPGTGLVPGARLA